MFGWIPILGPIFDGIVSIWKGYQQVDITKIKTAGTVTVEETKASANIIASTKDDICLRFLRDLVIAFPVFWFALIGWDTIWAEHDPSLMWHVANFPTTLAYYPYAVLVFLLGNIGINMWSRR